MRPRVQCSKQLARATMRAHPTCAHEALGRGLACRHLPVAGWRRRPMTWMGTTSAWTDAVQLGP